MTPKHKAEDLFYEMSTNSSDEDHHCSHYVAKQCALIAVDEIINSRPVITDSQVEYQKYWAEVRKEIEKL
jgi:hypothetical protein